MNRFIPLINNAILSLYLALAIATPLIFTTFNTELFEVPKMHYVYFVSILIFFLTFSKYIINRKITIAKNLTLTFFIIFVLLQVISTFFSIDKYTSVFGYPTRLNGGLISQFAYLIIFTGALVNLNYQNAKKVLVALVFSALAVSLWGIPGHFGYDPSCLVLRGELNSTCWKIDFQPTLRIFSTLGQPNWMASYLVLILPISISLFLTQQKRNNKLLFFIASVAIFWAIILTNSRAGILGAGLSAVIFLSLIEKKYFKTLIPLAISLIFIAIIFGTTITSRIQSGLVSQRTVTNITDNLSPQPTKPSQTSLQTGGTESGTIRLIVWKGALEIFKHAPILGTGPETFVSSYFKFRPLKHNQTSEWEFFYNKAHNEFLNYLANIGSIGFFSFMLFLSAAFFSIFTSRKKSVFLVAALAALAGYFTTIFFGFSTVATQLAALLILAISLIIKNEKSTLDIKLNLREKYIFPFLLTISLIGLFTLSFAFRMYLSNVYEKQAENFRSVNAQKELIAYTNALNTNPFKNPYLLANYSSSISLAAAAAGDKNKSSELSSLANQQAQKSLIISPNNFLIAQRVAKTYAILAGIDQKYENDAKNIALKLTPLAPNYPITYITNAKIEIILKNLPEAKNNLEKALELKGDYLEARQLLDQVEEKLTIEQ